MSSTRIGAGDPAAWPTTSSPPTTPGGRCAATAAGALLRDAFVRFRYGDGFSHSRAFAFQLCLAVVPFLIALTGLITDLGADEGGKVVADTDAGAHPRRERADGRRAARRRRAQPRTPASWP